MHRMRLVVLLLGAATTVLVALLAFFMALGGDGAPSVEAVVPTKTATVGPAPTPKPNALGNLSGVVDVNVHAPGNKAVTLFHCIARTDHDSVTNQIKTSAVCAADIDIGDPNGEPQNSVPNEGTDRNGDTIPDFDGPPPPPPFGAGEPAKGNGTYTGPAPASDTVVTTTCFDNVGGGLGPNIIATVTIVGAKAQLASTGKQAGTVDIFGNQSNAQCNSKTPSGTPSFAGLPINLNPINDGDPNCGGGPPPAPAPGDCEQVPWRTPGVKDYDNDGCSDADELWENKPASLTKCGDDPYNPHDFTTGTDVSGNYGILATAARANACKGGLPAAQCANSPDGTLVPGFYFTCLADIQQSGKALTARIYCYIDTPAIAVNSEAAGAANCVALAQAGRCGDGLPGAAPPGRTLKPDGPRNFGDVNTKHTVLTGTLDNAANTVNLSGCFIDNDGAGGLGNVYVTAKFEAHTGHGKALVYIAQTLANCTGATPVGSATHVSIDLVRQSNKAVPAVGPAETGAQCKNKKDDDSDGVVNDGCGERDNDSDGCPDKSELTDIAGDGGLRDPSNSYDYFNPTKDGLNRVDDILAVVNQYFVDDPDPNNPDLKSQTDRTGLLGGNPWNLGAPNGQQRVDDILASVKQYFHDCP